MQTWTAARYRQLARQCQTKANAVAPSEAKTLRTMAKEYDAKAEKLENR